MLAPANSHYVEAATPSEKEDFDMLFDGNWLSVGFRLKTTSIT